MGFSSRLTLSLGLCAATAVALPCVAQRANSGRVQGTRDRDTIFSPLDLPAASAWRLGSGAPGPEYWQQQVDYAIDAVLDAETSRLEAQMRIKYHNNAPTSLGFLWIQLEQNLFRPDSDGSKSRRGGIMPAMREDFQGGYELSYIRMRGKDMPYQVYDTLARVELPQPIKPGQTIAFEIGYGFDMPPYMRRMGAQDVEQGRIFEYAQWFPHVCVYDDVYGWNTLPYLGSGEFYTNFGNYDVRLTVPRDHIVAATGELQNPYDVLTRQQRDRIALARKSDETVIIRSAEEVDDPTSRPSGDGPLTWHFKAENVRTFAWASSEAFIWDGCNATVTEDDGTTRSVFCQSIYPAEATAWTPEAEGGGSSQYVKHAVEFYSDFLYPYPYPQMTNVNGPEGGMEYPMLVFCGGRTRSPFGVTDHEVGHTWFPMIVNTDERRHVWMDEGFNTFINAYSRANWSDRDVRVGGRGGRGRGGGNSPTAQPIVTWPDQMRGVGYLGYGKPGYGLQLLREYIMGPERFDYAFGEYIRRWVFKSPRPADFFRSMEDASGLDLSWFWRGWFLETGSLDQGIESVDQSENGTVRATFVNLGELVMPLEFEVTYDDGSTEVKRLPIEIWFNTNRRVSTWDADGRQVVAVKLDPRDLLPDTDPDNNAWAPEEPVEEEEEEQEQEDPADPANPADPPAPVPAPASGGG